MSHVRAPGPVCRVLRSCRIDAGTLRRQVNEEDVAGRARKCLTYRQKKGGIAFRRTLNAVIGGVSEAKAGKVRFAEKRIKSGRSEVDYEIDVTFVDTYDFDNARYGVYDQYRKRLSQLLLANELEEFEETYLREAHSFDDDFRTNKLDNTALFASFLYALERKGWTPGPLPWEVTVVLKGTLRN